MPDENLTGKVIVCILIDGTARRTPTAIIDVDTKYFRGQVEAVCMKKPMNDLIIGNIKDVVDEPSQSMDVEHHEEVT